MTQEDFHKRYHYNPNTDCLGEGGFGKVYKAYDTHRDRYVAIKMAEVRPHLEEVRLKKEVEIICKLPSHPNIAYYEECYTFSTFAGEYDFGVLQYYEEGNLQQLLTDKELSYEQKDSILRQILEGIIFLHSQGIIHRDLKPQNILIVNRNGKYIPKITDFGISKKLDENKSSIFTNSLAGAGTLSFASPEQLMGNTIRKNTDLWSFGVIACWAFTGKLPFNTGEQAVTSEAGRIELFKQITSGDISSIIQLLPTPWKSVIAQCIKVDNDNRINNASKCLELLDGEIEVINEQPLSEETTINEIINIAQTNETETPVGKEIEVEKPASNEPLLNTQNNETAVPAAKEIRGEISATNETVINTQTNETNAIDIDEIEVVVPNVSETIINTQTNNNASHSGSESEVGNPILTHVEPLIKTPSEPVTVSEIEPEKIINYTPWIIFCLVIVAGLVIFFGKPNWSSDEEQLEFARQDSIAMADSLAYVAVEQQRIRDSISEALDKIVSSVATEINSNSDSNPNNTNEVSQKIKVGQVYAGGIVFYLDATGQHGLVAASNDFINGFWGYEKILILGTSSSANNGASNTQSILERSKAPGIAARICSNQQLNGFSDWYLPSKAELNKMYQQKKLIGNFQEDYYWSSTEYNDFQAWGQYFLNGVQNVYNKQSELKIRAIRAF